MNKFLLSTFACVTLCLIADTAVGQARRIQFEFSPGSQYTFFPGTASSPFADSCDFDGCSFDIAGLFDLLIAADGSATIENADVVLSGNDVLDGSQFDVGSLLENHFLTLREEPLFLGTVYDLSLFPPPTFVPGTGAVDVPFSLPGELQLEFGIPLLDTPFSIGRLAGGPVGLVQGSDSFEFDGFLRQVSVTAVPEPTSILLLSCSGVAVTLRRVRKTA